MATQSLSSHSTACRSLAVARVRDGGKSGSDPSTATHGRQHIDLSAPGAVALGFGGPDLSAKLVEDQDRNRLAHLRSSAPSPSGEDTPSSVHVEVDLAGDCDRNRCQQWWTIRSVVGRWSAGRAGGPEPARFGPATPTDGQPDSSIRFRRSRPSRRSSSWKSCVGTASRPPAYWPSVAASSDDLRPDRERRSRGPPGRPRQKPVVSDPPRDNNPQAPTEVARKMKARTTLSALHRSSPSELGRRRRRSLPRFGGEPRPCWSSR